MRNELWFGRHISFLFVSILWIYLSWNNFNMIFTILQFCTVIWIALIVYKSGVLEHLSSPTDKQAKNISQDATASEALSSDEGRKAASPVSSQSGGSWWFQGELVDPDGAVRHTDVELWQHLSYKHWPTLFSYYNISLYGK